MPSVLLDQVRQYVNHEMIRLMESLPSQFLLDPRMMVGLQVSNDHEGPGVLEIEIDNRKMQFRLVQDNVVLERVIIDLRTKQLRDLDGMTPISGVSIALPAAASNYRLVSGLLLLDGLVSADPGSTVDLPISTSPLWALLRPFAWALQDANRNSDVGLDQLNLLKSQGNFTNFWGRFFDVTRNEGEEDRAYAERIVQETIRPRDNNLAIAQILEDDLGVIPTAVTDALPAVFQINLKANDAPIEFPMNFNGSNTVILEEDFETGTGLVTFRLRLYARTSNKVVLSQGNDDDGYRIWFNLESDKGFELDTNGGRWRAPADTINLKKWHDLELVIDFSLTDSPTLKIDGTFIALTEDYPATAALPDGADLYIGNDDFLDSGFDGYVSHAEVLSGTTTILSIGDVSDADKLGTINNMYVPGNVWNSGTFFIDVDLFAFENANTIKDTIDKHKAAGTKAAIIENANHSASLPEESFDVDTFDISLFDTELGTNEAPGEFAAVVELSNYDGVSTTNKTYYQIDTSGPEWIVGETPMPRSKITGGTYPFEYEIVVDPPDPP